MFCVLQDKFGNSALHEAARGAHTSIVKALINSKADKTKINNKNQKFYELVRETAKYICSVCKNIIYTHDRAYICDIEIGTRNLKFLAAGIIALE